MTPDLFITSHVRRRSHSDGSDTYDKLSTLFMYNPFIGQSIQFTRRVIYYTLPSFLDCKERSDFRNAYPYSIP